MKKTLRALSTLWLLAIGLLSISAGAASAAALIQAQPPCGGYASFPGGNCVSIVGGNSNVIFPEFFKFKAPSKGNAEVTFHGSLLCSSDTTAGNKVADVVTQVTTSLVTPQPNQPGGLRLATVLSPNTTQTLNLASTRVVPFSAAGSKTFYFAVNRLRLDAGVTCYGYNLAFTVVFIP